MSKRIQGWNPTYFGEPKKGSLASVIADITNKQNEQQEEAQKEEDQQEINPNRSFRSSILDRGARC